MKNSMTNGKLKASFSMAFLVVLFNLLLTSACFFLLWYWLIPKTFPLFPNLARYLQGLDDDSLRIAYDIVYTAGAVLAIFPGTVLAYRMSKRWKKAFLAYSSGRISYSEGVRYHLTEYGISDGIALTVTVFVFALASVAFNGGVAKLFPMVFYLCRSLGGLLGLCVSMILLFSSALVGIFFAQKKWRADYFLGE